MLLVANPRAVDKQGVRNEIQIASEVARKIGDSAFIIPLRMERFDAPFLIAHAQYIDFTRGWAADLQSSWRPCKKLSCPAQRGRRRPDLARYTSHSRQDASRHSGAADFQLAPDQQAPEEDPVLRIQGTHIGNVRPRH